MRRLVVLLLLVLSTNTGCRSRDKEVSGRAGPVGFSYDAASPVGQAASIPGGVTQDPVLVNRAAYIPAQCYTKTRATPGERAKNPCYACHVRSEPPNYVQDTDLQVQWSMPAAGWTNHWTNLFDPPYLHGARQSDDEVLAYVRKSNYFDDHGDIPLARTLAKLPPEWDSVGKGQWDGYIPDAAFSFDEKGYDRHADGTPTGWRAFAYYPFLGTFFPTNGSFDDVMIRLDPMLREDREGHFDARTYEINFAIVESLVRRMDVPIEPVDEHEFGVDLDLNGTLGRATQVTFDPETGVTGFGAGQMHYVGRAKELEKDGRFPIAMGLFPLQTEFLHTVRYLDIAKDGTVVMAPRMKELRYAKKVRWYSHELLRMHAMNDINEQLESPDGSLRVLWEGNRGIYNDQGWLYQGFIEAADGSLRPQSYEESAYCYGCHGEVGRTTDGIFSFPRRLGPDSFAKGWFHWTQHDLRALPEPRSGDGQYEYTRYLRENGAGDELRENTEVLHRFFDEKGVLRADQVELLHQDITRLLLPSRERALDLDRAYAGIVREQSFAKGRDAVLAASTHVYAEAPRGEKTGIEHAVDDRGAPKGVSRSSQSGKPVASQTSRRPSSTTAKVPSQP